MPNNNYVQDRYGNKRYGVEPHEDGGMFPGKVIPVKGIDTPVCPTCGAVDPAPGSACPRGTEKEENCGQWQNTSAVVMNDFKIALEQHTAVKTVELEELRKDRSRLDWLEKGRQPGYWKFFCVDQDDRTISYDNECGEETLRGAIDAAILFQKSGKEKKAQELRQQIKAAQAELLALTQGEENA